MKPFMFFKHHYGRIPARRQRNPKSAFGSLARRAFKPTGGRWWTLAGY
jgi:hypothetical protein